MSLERQRYRTVQGAFFGLTLATFIALGFLIARFVPWLPYSLGQATDCGCTSLAFQVPWGVTLGGAVLVSLTLLLAGRWAWSFIRHVRQWHSASAEAKHHGRLVTHGRLQLSYWIVPAQIAQAYSIAGWNPSVIVTTALVYQLSGSELEAVLRHEQSHARQHDALWSALIDASGYMFGWPMWLREWAAAAYSWRELSADAEATSNYNHVSALSGAVVKLSALHTEQPGVGFSPNVDRIEKILNPSWTPMHRLWSGRAVLAIGIGVSIFLAAGAGLKNAHASLPPYPTGQCPMRVEVLLCQQPATMPLKLRCVQASGWQCSPVPNRSLYAPLSHR